MLADVRKNRPLRTLCVSEQTCSCQMGEEGGRGTDREFGSSSCQLVYIGWINNKVLLDSTGNHTQYPLIKDNGKEYEKEYTSESLYCTAEIQVTLKINYMLQQNKILQNKATFEFGYNHIAESKAAPRGRTYCMQTHCVQAESCRNRQRVITYTKTQMQKTH